MSTAGSVQPVAMDTKSVNSISASACLAYSWLSFQRLCRLRAARSQRNIVCVLIDGIYLSISSVVNKMLRAYHGRQQGGGAGGEFSVLSAQRRVIFKFTEYADAIDSEFSDDLAIMLEMYLRQFIHFTHMILCAVTSHHITSHRGEQALRKRAAEGDQGRKAAAPERENKQRVRLLRPAGARHGRRHQDAVAAHCQPKDRREAGVTCHYRRSASTPSRYS